MYSFGIPYITENEKKSIPTVLLLKVFGIEWSRRDTYLHVWCVHYNIPTNVVQYTQWKWTDTQFVHSSVDNDNEIIFHGMGERIHLFRLPLTHSKFARKGIFLTKNCIHIFSLCIFSLSLWVHSLRYRDVCMLRGNAYYKNQNIFLVIQN